MVAGPATRLDEPGDLALNGGTLWVAERESDRLLRFDGLLGLSGDAPPDATLALPEVDSVELNPEFLSRGTGGSMTTD